MSWTGRADQSQPVAIDDDIAAEFAAMGATVQPADHQEQSEDFEVWKKNWPSLVAFLACETQWRAIAGLERIHWLGLDYSAVDVVLRRLKSPKRVFRDLQAMEHAALSILNEVSHG